MANDLALPTIPIPQNRLELTSACIAIIVRQALTIPTEEVRALADATPHFDLTVEAFLSFRERLEESGG